MSMYLACPLCLIQFLSREQLENHQRRTGHYADAEQDRKSGVSR